mmetsp:Transcript_4454/g.11715  ORF Transcript_4454/g.11715 Transcript_4454/m.11715 type:complete len:100 (-) Transcript_4454:585-884(-)
MIQWQCIILTSVLAAIKCKLQFSLYILVQSTMLVFLPSYYRSVQYMAAARLSDVGGMLVASIMSFQTTRSAQSADVVGSSLMELILYNPTASHTMFSNA